MLAWLGPLGFPQLESTALYQHGKRGHFQEFCTTWCRRVALRFVLVCCIAVGKHSLNVGISSGQVTKEKHWWEACKMSDKAYVQQMPAPVSVLILWYLSLANP